MQRNLVYLKITKQKLTLDKLVTYQIKVPGHLNESWADWVGGMMVTVECDCYSLLATTLTGSFDQAVLQGLLRLLNSLGLPLISAIWIKQ